MRLNTLDGPVQCAEFDFPCLIEDIKSRRKIKGTSLYVMYFAYKTTKWAGKVTLLFEIPLNKASVVNERVPYHIV